MDEQFNIDDPSDWLQTSTPLLASVDSASRCQVCKDFYNTPMITSCSHTFCSLCIRRCLTNDGKCPACRAPDQELRLRRNWTVQELVDGFRAARPSLLLAGKNMAVTNGDLSHMRNKRKVPDSDGDDAEEARSPPIQRRKTRSSREKLTRSCGFEPSQDSEDDQDPEYLPDGLTACPICNKRMKEGEVFLHLDIHAEPGSSVGQNSVIPIQKPFLNPTPKSQHSKPPDRLPQLSYSLLKDTALRKKMAEIGIPSGGPRILLIRRHTEWINLVNANCDSSKPRSKSDLLRELEVWDRSQGRHATNGVLLPANTATVMRKDFNGTTWAAAHDNEFQELIGKARQNLASNAIKNLPNELYENPDLNKPFCDLISSPKNQDKKATLSDSGLPLPKSVP